VAAQDMIVDASCCPAKSAEDVPVMYRKSEIAGSVGYGKPMSVLPAGGEKLRVPSAPRPPAARKSAKDAGLADMDLLMALLSLQRVDGGFDLDAAMLARLGIAPAAVAAAAAGLPGDSKTAVRALHTAIVLAVLEARFGDSRDTWFAAVRKSRTWLKQAAGGDSLARKAKELVENAAGPRNA